MRSDERSARGWLRSRMATKGTSMRGWRTRPSSDASASSMLLRAMSISPLIRSSTGEVSSWCMVLRGASPSREMSSAASETIDPTVPSNSTPSTRTGWRSLIWASVATACS